MVLTVGSLFSGCGGMDIGFERAGFVVRWHAEIDKDAVSVLARHWPGVAQLGSVTDIDGAQIEPVDVVIGGFPCQDVSLAGKRKGLSGERSGLFYEFVRIVEEMRGATGGRYPAVAVFENVYGLLSSHAGRDFAAVLAGLRNSGAAVAFRVLDAQFFGVPQRRRRVFIVADFAPVGVGERRAAHVLALGESMCGHPAAGGESREGSAAPAEVGAGMGGEPLVYQCHGTSVGPIGTLRSGNGHLTGGVPFLLEPVAAFGGNRTSGPIDVAACLSTSNQRLDFETQTLIVSSDVAATLTAGGHPNSNAPGRRREDDANYGPRRHEGVLLRDGLCWIVRRLTPTEGERCMGYQDDWTRWRADGSEISDSARWRLIGNGVASPVAEWIAKRLHAALEGCS